MKYNSLTTLLLFGICSFVMFGCQQTQEPNEKVGKQVNLENKEDTPPPTNLSTNSQLATFLTFQENNAEEAMKFYVSLFDNSEITEIQRHEAGGPAKEGTIFKASFLLNGKRFICSDSYIKHEWDFTPGVSIWVDCRDEMEQKTLFEKLSENGNVLMPLGNYGFSQQFAFVEDRFGVSWQLNFQ